MLDPATVPAAPGLPTVAAAPVVPTVVDAGNGISILVEGEADTFLWQSNALPPLVVPPLIATVPVVLPPIATVSAVPPPIATIPPPAAAPVVKPPDTRQVISGQRWQKADAISSDCKQMYGANFANTYLCGTVTAVMARFATAKSKRKTTYITATYTIGNQTKSMEFAQGSLVVARPASSPNLSLPENQLPVDQPVTYCVVIPPAIQTVYLPRVISHFGAYRNNYY